MDGSLDGGAGLLRLMDNLFGYLGSALIYIPYVVGGCPGASSAESHFYGLSNAAGALTLHTYFCRALGSDASERRCLYTNMDLLVAGLQGVDPYGLYQYGSLSLVERERKDIRSVAPIPLSPSFASTKICSV